MIPEASDLASAPDDHLMLAVAAGDMQAFRALTDRHLPGMVALAQRILASAADADDVVQEAFLRLWKNAAQWEAGGKAQIRTWLSRVVTNLCLDLWRRKRTVPLDLASEVPDPAKNALERVQESSRRRLLQQCLSRLPIRQRVAVILSYYEGLDGKEIARTMSLSPGAVESLLVRARRALRRELKSINVVLEDDL